MRAVQFSSADCLTVATICWSLFLGVAAAQTSLPDGPAWLPSSPEQLMREFSKFGDQFWREFATESEDERRLLDSIDVSIGEERKWGESQFKLYVQSLRRQGIRVTSRGPDAQYLSKLAGQVIPLLQHADRYRDVRIYVAATDMTDARSFPGGYIVFSTGLLGFAESEAAVVGVLAHELSHIDRGHQLDTVRKTKLAQQLLESGRTTAAEFLTTSKLLIGQFARPFRPEQEEEADHDAAHWTFQAGYDPMEMARMFLRLHQRDRDRQLPMLTFFRSHPFHVDRYKAIRQIANDLAAEPADLYIGRRNLQLRIPRGERRFPD